MIIKKADMSPYQIKLARRHYNKLGYEITISHAYDPEYDLGCGLTANGKFMFDVAPTPAEVLRDGRSRTMAGSR